MFDSVHTGLGSTKQGWGRCTRTGRVDYLHSGGFDRVVRVDPARPHTRRQSRPSSGGIDHGHSDNIDNASRHARVDRPGSTAQGQPPRLAEQDHPSLFSFLLLSRQAPPSMEGPGKGLSFIISNPSPCAGNVD